MTIYERVEAALNGVFTSYYHGMPEFANMAEPDTYAVYTLTSHRPQHFASGVKTSDGYFVSLAVFTKAIAPDLYEEAENAFLAVGFSYMGGRDVSAATSYPGRIQYSMDFTINIDKQED